jgi:hypothetical protein
VAGEGEAIDARWPRINCRFVILLSLHQRKLISQAADSLPPSQRGDFIECVAGRLQMEA